jgi:hypothetical protein
MEEEVGLLDEIEQVGDIVKYYGLGIRWMQDQILELRSEMDYAMRCLSAIVQKMRLEDVVDNITMEEEPENLDFDLELDPDFWAQFQAIELKLEP